MLLEIEHLHIDWKTKREQIGLVRDVSLQVHSGETVALVGESGSGKTLTAFSCLKLMPSAAVQIAQGKALFQGQDLFQLKEREMRQLRGNRIAMVFQDPMSSLNPFLSIERQLTEVLEVHQGLSRLAAREKSIEALRQVGLPEPEKRIWFFPHQFSGGQRQRILIAMAILCEPLLLIADEPTTALDVTIQAQILQLLKSLKAQKQMSMLLISHDLGVVAGLADRIYVMYAGRIVEEATRDELLQSPKHPYTQALLRSIPIAEGPRRLQAIPGSVPELRQIGPGCPFENRCEHVLPRCRERFPAAISFSPTHRSYCLEAERL